MEREKVYETKLLSGETVALRVRYGEEMESESNTRGQAEKRRGAVQRILIPQPMGSTPTDTWKPPRPLDYKGQRIEVTAHVSEHGEIVERWAFSEEDIRYYRLQIDGKAIMLESKPKGETPA